MSVYQKLNSIKKPTLLAVYCRRTGELIKMRILRPTGRVTYTLIAVPDALRQIYFCKNIMDARTDRLFESTSCYYTEGSRLSEVVNNMRVMIQIKDLELKY